MIITYIANNSYKVSGKNIDAIKKVSKEYPPWPK